jgi:DNA-binding beta-propeller fold protein YncE
MLRFYTFFSLVASVVFCFTANAQYRAVVVNKGSDSITVFDPLKGTIIKNIVCNIRPQHVVIKGKTGYILYVGSGKEPGSTIDILDLNSYTVKQTIQLENDARPHWGMLSRNKKILWATFASKNAIVEINLKHNKVVRTWNTKQPGSYNFTVTKDDKEIYVANFDTPTVSIISRLNGKVDVVNIGGKPIGIDVSADGRKVWVSSFVTNHITVLNKATHQIIKTFPSSGAEPMRIKFTNDGSKVLITHGTGKELAVYDANTYQLLWKIPIEGNVPKSLAISPDDKYALVSLIGGDEVLVIDIIEKTIINRIRTGKNPEGVAFF